ncbi:MAG: hypothetical protein A2Y77_16320 [Planctomycetes bacterium RBG_13_62_9]|nr:MAG: hypothetical protein A2Y77_16320 [Planctomycetes bacterium RBG_13_62_9]
MACLAIVHAGDRARLMLRTMQKDREFGAGGWQRHAQLGDGDLPVRRTIAKAFGLGAATRSPTLRLPW